MAETRERWRKRLPHWEVEGRPHFVTIRCAGSIPAAAAERLREIHRSLQTIEPRSPEFAQQQRHYFLATEKYLDVSDGFAPFLDADLASRFASVLASLTTSHGWTSPHWVAMPNHVHLLLVPASTGAVPLHLTIAQLKGRSARTVNHELHRTGPFWQAEWFDHWVRDDAEQARIIAYIRQNPVKAALVRSWEEYAWVR
jgi:REP element-mobilizing transposase RayT